MNHHRSAQPPPTKKHKGNPVVTYYPPPPGYAPPLPNAAPPTGWPTQAYATGAYPYPQQQYYQYPYNQGPHQYPVYPPQAGHPSLVPYPSQPTQYPPAAYGYDQTIAYPAASANGAGYGVSSVTAPLELQSNTSFVSFLGPQSAQQPSIPSISISRHPSVSRSVTAKSVDGDREAPSHEFDEDDYTREASYTKGDDHPPPTLTLGVIIYRPADSVKTALSSDPKEAEIQRIAPAPREGEDVSVSKYFAASQVFQVDHSIRDGNEWPSVQGDLIFRDLKLTAEVDYVKISAVKADRQRKDLDTRPYEPRARTPTPEGEAETTPHEPELVVADSGADAEINGNDDDDAMDMDSGEDDEDDDSTAVDADKISTGQGSQPPASNGHIPRDQAQEDVLASLGVSGSPKAVKADAIADDGLHADQIAQHDALQPNGQAESNGAWHQQDEAAPYGPNRAPPPPPPRKADYRKSWNGHGRNDRWERRRPGSTSTEFGTRAVSGGYPDGGLPFYGQTPRQTEKDEKPSSGRKRAFDEVEHLNGDNRNRRDTGSSPRGRKFRPRGSNYQDRRHR